MTATEAFIQTIKNNPATLDAVISAETKIQKAVDEGKYSAQLSMSFTFRSEVEQYLALKGFNIHPPFNFKHQGEDRIDSFEVSWANPKTN